MNSCQLPGLSDVERILSVFVRRKVQVRLIPTASDGHLPLAGLYYDGNDSLVTACMADVAFAAASAAAFALIPARVALEAANAKVLDDSLAEIFCEVLNVMSRLFTHHENLRVTLKEKVMPGQSLPAVLADLDRAQCLDLQVEIEGYGQGRLTLCVLTP